MKYNPWVHIKAGLKATEAWSKSELEKHYVAEFKSVLKDAEVLREVVLLVDDMLEPGQLWSVNPTKLHRVRKAVEALPERLLNG